MRRFPCAHPYLVPGAVVLHEISISHLFRRRFWFIQKKNTTHSLRKNSCRCPWICRHKYLKSRKMDGIFTICHSRRRNILFSIQVLCRRYTSASTFYEVVQMLHSRPQTSSWRPPSKLCIAKLFCWNSKKLYQRNAEQYHRNARDFLCRKDKHSAAKSAARFEGFSAAPPHAFFLDLQLQSVHRLESAPSRDRPWCRATHKKRKTFRLEEAERANVEAVLAR
jgi:hypothetical protein